MDTLPVTLQAIVDEAKVTPITVGHSSDQVYRLEAEDVYYLKIGQSLRAESERLQWLQGKLPVPQLLHFEINHGKHYLLTSAIEGDMLFAVDLPVKRCLEIYAEAAHMWHELPVGHCPFEWGIPQQIDTARHRMNHNLVDEDDLEPCYYGKTVHQLFAELLTAMPDDTGSAVITHGDFSLPNVLIDAQTQQITGFVDVGEFGVSDRYLDLVLAAWSIQYNFGGKYIPYFYEQYGVPENPAKTHFYSLLNAFF